VKYMAGADLMLTHHVTHMSSWCNGGWRFVHTHLLMLSYATTARGLLRCCNMDSCAVLSPWLGCALAGYSRGAAMIRQLVARATILSRSSQRCELLS
jgi:hypothetical protein